MDDYRPAKILKPKQRIALIALAFGERPGLVAARADVSLRTLYRWRRDPDFLEALHSALDDFHGNYPQEEAAARIIAFHALADVARRDTDKNPRRNRR